jgi:hypothetical protein
MARRSVGSTKKKINLKNNFMPTEIEKNYQEISLYKGEIKLKFFPETHIYMMNGKRCKSPTGAIGIIDKSKQLIPWALEMAGDFLQLKTGAVLTPEIIDEALEQHQIKKTEAAGIGTEAHDWIEQFIKGKKPPMPEQEGAAKAIAGFLDWKKKNKVKFIASEKLVYSKKYGYAGTLDGIAEIDGKIYIIDYKVSKGLYPGVAMQTAAYQFADEEESGTKYAGRWAIRLSKETEEEYNLREEKKLAKYMRKNQGKNYEIKPWAAFEARLLTNYERDLKIFVTALNLSTFYGELDKEFFAAR